MFKKILIVNRGEIAVRIIRACKEMGISAAAVYSDVDRNALHVEMADEAYCIGTAYPKNSYLNVPSILSLACLIEADAIHPGYGFLAENANFARACTNCGVVFIGPNPETIERMGDKAQARITMKSANVPVIPGSDGIVENTEDVVRLAKEYGFPVIIKATAGGGGKGMRVVYNEEEIGKAYGQARREAESYFGNADLYVEKYLERPRHIEIQVIADKNQNVVHLNERDCSVQRRNQKIVEESPSPVMTLDIREQMGNAAIKICEAVKYVGVGTIEFLLDQENKFYFMEMNTRIQVEHPVTEMITGIDLVKEQIAVADGCPLSFTQSDVGIEGWAIECRINAEDPGRDFMPSPGRIEEYRVPGGFGVRVDSSAYPGYTIPPFYDSMIAKIIVWGKNREEAIQRMKRALGEFKIAGVVSNINFHLKLMNSKSFVEGDYDTSLLKNKL